MNFLAHFYLSQTDQAIIQGNFLGDFVKGTNLDEFPNSIQNGIRFHRFIDHTMDVFPHHEHMKQILRDQLGKYAPVGMDLVFDRVLAMNWRDYSQQRIEDFEMSIFNVLSRCQVAIPPDAEMVFQAMQKGKWMSRNANLDGFARSCYGLSKRVKYESGLEGLPDLFVRNSELFEDAFKRFFPHMVWTCFEKYASFVRVDPLGKT